LPLPEPSLGHLTDDQLMEQVRYGRTAAFSTLVERYQAAAWSVARRFTGDDQSARDLVQDTFLRIFEYAPRYTAQGQFRALLFRVLSNRAFNLQRERRTVAMESPPETPSDSGSEETLETARRNRAVEAALDSLPPNQRMAVVLRYFQDLGYDEIGRALDVSQKAVERLLARARESLRTTLRE
jgi:RNA polymerase sigma-70 factor (ECF subfamily)